MEQRIGTLRRVSSEGVLRDPEEQLLQLEEQGTKQQEYPRTAHSELRREVEVPPVAKVGVAPGNSEPGLNERSSE